MAFTSNLDNRILDQVFGQTALANLANVHIGLSTTAPAADGTGVTEPSGSGYARVTVANNKTNFSTAAAGSVKNATAITFPQATGAWGTVAYFLIYDDASTEVLIAYGTLSASKAINSGDTASFAANAITVSLA